MSAKNTATNDCSNSSHPFQHLIKQLDGKKYFSLEDLDAEKLKSMPYCMRVLLEAAVRCCDNFEVKEQDAQRLLDWQTSSKNGEEIAFKPSRVLLQDFTGVPAVVDLAAMRDAIRQLGAAPELVNPMIPTDLVIDHSVAVDFASMVDALEKNEELEFERNHERFAFLKWGKQAFRNMSVVPPGSGIVHQVNLEYLARVVFADGDCLYPDSVVGTDSHTTMIDGLGVLGWGVGGIEAEAMMLGQPICMVVPQVVGFNLSGKLPANCTATDLVLRVTQILRQYNVVGKLVEFHGPGLETLSVADRATIANMSPEFGATAAYFPCDEKTIKYLQLTGRDPAKLQVMEKYLKTNHLFRTVDGEKHIVYSGQPLSLNLSEVVPALAGPKRPHDHLPLTEIKSKFDSYLCAPLGFKGFGLKEEQKNSTAAIEYQGKKYELRHGCVVIAAITSCTNTSNPAVMLQAGLMARNAARVGLEPPTYVKCSLSPGSHVVYSYLKDSGLYDSLMKCHFFVSGFGCQTCIGNSGDVAPEVAAAVAQGDLVAAAVLSGNRNFEGRIHPLTRANYLASPPLVVAYALAGTVCIDFDKEPIGFANGDQTKPVFLKDLWPTAEEVEEYIQKFVQPSLFKKAYETITEGNARWSQMKIPTGDIYEWSPDSTYIHNPPYFDGMKKVPDPIQPISNARCLLNLGDSITTDHISPAGKIAIDSPAAEYLRSRGVSPKDFNSYGSRRGNDEIMVRGTFANIRLMNKMANKVGPFAVHQPSGEQLSVYDVALKYREEGVSCVIIAGAEYGCGSSRDWAAKGSLLQGVRAVIAQSYERIHRSNLVGMGIVPLQFEEGQNAETLKLTGHKQKFTIDLTNLAVRGKIEVEVTSDDDESVKNKFSTCCRIDTEVELQYYKHGGILKYVLRKMAGVVPSSSSSSSS